MTKKTSTKSFKSAKSAHAHKDTQLPLLEYMERLDPVQSAQTADMLRTVLRAEPSKDLWPGLICVPPSSLVEQIIIDFQLGTNIPLEIPFFSILSIISGYLLSKKTTITIQGDETELYPDIWTILLSESGSSKSLTFNRIKSMDASIQKDVIFELQGIESSAIFFDLLNDNNERLAYRDEFNEFYKDIQNKTGPLGRLKDFLLEIYNNTSISYKTKKECERTIERPILAFFGQTVTDSFLKYLEADDIVNGLLQRFAIVHAVKDPSRDPKDFAFYKLQPSKWTKKWNELKNSIKFSNYICDEYAMEGYVQAFRLLYNYDIPESFNRRLLWRSHKYALIYHIICNKGNKQTLDQEDYGWAGRVISMHLHDMSYILKQYNKSELQLVTEKCEKVIQRFKAEGKTIRPRDLIHYVRDIKTAGQAKFLLDVITH